MNGNYLEVKYPNTGYKKERYTEMNYSHFKMPWARQTKEEYQKEQEEKKRMEEEQKEIDLIPRFPCVNVCECGEEWEDKFAEYQEGCYPYLEKTCRKCSAIKEEKRAEEERKYKEQLRLNAFYESLPTRYRNNLTTVKHKELLNASCCIIWGDFGTGKSWEAYTLVKELYETNKIESWEMLTEMDLINSLRDFDSLEYKIDSYKGKDLLIIDETGKSNETDHNRAQLFSILNYRYEWEKKTVLICNAKDKTGVRELMPTAILDRFRECVVEMKGNSLRYVNKGTSSE